MSRRALNSWLLATTLAAAMATAASAQQPAADSIMKNFKPVTADMLAS